MHFADALTARTKATSPVCVGLDPVIDKLPEGIEKTPAGVATFCRGIIDATAEFACCIKPQLAYFEVLGWEGMKVFWEISAYAKQKNLLVIADGKRNDIGSTCEAYAEAYLGKDKPIDALTVSPYLGSDGIIPFIEQAVANNKGIFVLVKTSNTSSGELQDLPVGDEVVHEHLAQLVEGWGAQHLGKTNLSCVGAVVGATYPEEMKYLRTLMPHIPFLIPGYGAQGGTAEEVKHGFIPDGTGAIVNASRSIIYASKGKDWQEAAKMATAKMAEELHGVLRK
ncbi:orotidine 5'-phosphate decarboxylase [Candidatus Peribacteria bacterium RIFCSPHIGHO2_02_FULL_53_20]|nr:MAG: orotidine 5'-phosphate decarboxylase [Candidatus Peribacteria bacterium RIFCSPHIGHO2_02_FULL_53_20]OGJ67186.1 MAG: orotidine 5'-phosphate decarboxylase [Candidatus Peribacteria bacterium RIFCSPLOWO2_01_FULL_53_10]